MNYNSCNYNHNYNYFNYYYWHTYTRSLVNLPISMKLVQACIGPLLVYLRELLQQETEMQKKAE